MCCQIFLLMQMNVYLLCASWHISVLFYPIWFDCCDEVRNYLSSRTHGVLMWRTQDLEGEEFCRWKKPCSIKGQWTQHRILLVRWSYLYGLIIVQHAWETHGWVHGTTKRKEKSGFLFCIIFSFAWKQGGAGGSDLPSVSKSFCLSFKWKPCSIIHEGEGVTRSCPSLVALLLVRAS